MKKSEQFDLSAVLGSVSNLDTGGAPGTLTMIPAGQINPNEKNFYEVSDVDSLVDAILMDGLQSPLVVHRKGAAEYTIISGHRRFKALQQIIDDGLIIEPGKLFAIEISGGNIPCLVNAYKDDLQAELALIRANSDTRILSSSEKARQVERVEDILYQMKEQGHAFPGKMRDYVADACQVSASRIARLKMINENLIAKFTKLYKKDTIKESVAYALAQLPADRQEKLFACYEKWNYLYESDVKSFAAKLDDLEVMKCKQAKGESCSNGDRKLDKLINSRYSYAPCSSTCCAKCSQLSTCKNSCAKLADQVKEIKTDAREKKKQERLAREERDAPIIARIQELWTRFGEARRQAGCSVKEACDIIDRYYGSGTENDWTQREAGELKVKKEDALPYGYHFYTSYADSLVAAADRFGCSVDFLLCRTESPAVSGAFVQPDLWQKGAPKEPGYYFCLLGPLKGGAKCYYWNGESWEHPVAKMPVELDPIMCTPMPKLPEGLDWMRKEVEG